MCRSCSLALDEYQHSESLLDPMYLSAKWAWEKPGQFCLVQVSKVFLECDSKTLKPGICSLSPGS